MKIKLNMFEGPLDLLLYLVKKNHLEITDIPVSNVVEQYLDFLELMKNLDIDVASEYMVIAALLINIKSKTLLPSEKEEEVPEEDPRQELMTKLAEYQKFREAASYLKQKEGERSKYVSRITTSQRQEEVFVEASIFDLISAFKSALKEVPRDVFFEVVKDECTVEEKMHDLLHLLVDKDSISLGEIFGTARSRFEIVVIFLTILELIRLNEIIALQRELFSPVVLTKRDKVCVPS